MWRRNTVKPLIVVDAAGVLHADLEGAECHPEKAEAAIRELLKAVADGTRSSLLPVFYSEQTSDVLELRVSAGRNNLS